MMLASVWSTLSLTVIVCAFAWTDRSATIRLMTRDSRSRRRLPSLRLPPESLVLGYGNALHLLDLDGRCFVLGVNRTGLQSLVPLSPSFQETWRPSSNRTAAVGTPASPRPPRNEFLLATLPSAVDE
jgi:hypothetical protein